jgi:hypothetical protein
MKKSYIINNLDEAQCDLVMRSRDFINANGSRPESAANPDLYLNSWARVRGNARLRILQNGIKGIPYYLLRWLADFKSYLTKSNMICSPERVQFQKYTNIVLSWGMLNDFDNCGTYFDRYFATSSKDTSETLWIILYSSSKKPKVIEKNIMLLYWHNHTFFESFLKLFSTIFSFSKMSSFSQQSSQKISAVVTRELACNSSIKKVILPYEAQPFQQTLFECIKRNFPNVESVGYLHSSPPPLPTDLLYRKGCPSNLMVHGEGIKVMLSEQFNWPLKNLTVIKSLRYTQESSKKFDNEILLPYSFNNADRILDTFKIVLKKSLINEVNLWSVRNHPVQLDSVAHLKLEESLNQIISSACITATDCGSNIKQTIMIGATAAILEALEQGIEVIHIVSDPLLEAHSSLIWRYIDVERLGDYIFLYKMKEIGKYIRMGDASNNFVTTFS